MNRFKELRQAKGKTQQQIAALLSISQAAYSKYECNKAEPDFESLKILSELYGVSSDYLVGISDSTESENTASNLTPISGNEMFTFKVIGTITAGYGGGTDYNPTGEEIAIPRHLLKSHNPNDYFVLEVRGNSMFPLYLDGDKVLIRKCNSVDSGKIAAIGYDGEDATLKKVEYVKGENWMRLIPRNPEYPTKTIRNGDLELCRVYGEVVYLFRDNVGF